ncbi:NUDIX domain-containing protein [Planomonospora parontospora]|uniref:NUDIX domain-containing protein n=1 Tax=Planomonospora parontospora TaxID=58119 RepID=UPI001943F64A|nr:NUDIX domain-containing protein [Planomonospora parontospora]GGL54949.1 hypothetical protein GCM10014719_65330 [Planomonospora parontospora subsp. antibiotica]GII19296.1 hypothetical protein Ppa05_60220 [Planomonospora parontospora subsp. antibiotica]
MFTRCLPREPTNPPLWPGGHADDQEDPRASAVRELAEELRIAPGFHPAFGDVPCFLTVTQTRGVDSHTDVTLWFAFQANRDAVIVPDEREFAQVRWVPIDGRQGWPHGVFDPGLERFLDKLRTRLGRTPAAAG